MEYIQAALDYIRSNPSEFEGYLQEHLRLSVTAILIGFALCFPLSWSARRLERKLHAAR